MKIGFTGTRHGMTAHQKAEVRSALLGATEFHHGDCVGADEEAHAIALELGIPVVIHPPVKEEHRAFCKGACAILPAKGHIPRNRDIVNQTDRLVGTPFEAAEQQRGGTWSTIRFGYEVRGYGLVTVIPPDGIPYFYGPREAA